MDKKNIYYCLALIVLVIMGIIFFTNHGETQIDGTTIIMDGISTHYSESAFWLLLNFSWIVIIIPMIIPLIQTLKGKYWSAAYSLYFGLFMLFILNLVATFNSTSSMGIGIEQNIETWHMIGIILLTSLFSVSGNVMGISIEKLVHKKELIIPEN